MKSVCYKKHYVWCCGIVNTLYLGVFPAHAGVFLRQAGLLKFLSSFPRTRGGVSWFMPPLVVCIWFSPHTRGCFQRKRYVGGIGDGFPRTRGGVSNYRLEDSINMEFSPHTRGCFCLKRATEAMLVVFPAHAGVFLQATGIKLQRISFPRTRGVFASKSLSDFTRFFSFLRSFHLRVRRLKRCFAENPARVDFQFSVARRTSEENREIIG